MNKIFLIIFLSGCGSHLHMTSQKLRGQYFLDPVKRNFQAEYEGKGIDAFGSYSQEALKPLKKESYWTVIGGPFKGPEVKMTELFKQEDHEAFRVEQVKITTTFTWADVLLGWIPGFSKRTVKVGGKVTNSL